MSPSTVFAFACPLILALLCSYGGETKPLFGLSSLLTSTDTNGTNILAALALAHAQHTINKLEQLAELLAFGTNATANLLVG